MDTKAWMDKYTKPPTEIFMPLVGVGLTLFGFGMMGAVLPMGLVCIGLGIFFLYMSAPKGAKEYKAWWSAMEAQGKAQQVLEDFQGAADYMGGGLRLGRYWAYSKRAGVPCAYTDMVQVYQSIHKTNFVEDDRKLMVKTVTGQTKALCDLPLRGKGDAELNRVIQALLAHNPNIQVGYQK